MKNTSVKNKAPSKRLRLFHITGPIAAGKSKLGRSFAGIGIPVLDADHVVRKLREENDQIREALINRYGSLEPQVIRARLFNDPSEKTWIEQLIHPWVERESLSWMEEKSAKMPRITSRPWLVYESPLLLPETHSLYRHFDERIVVIANEDSRAQRLCERMGISRSEYVRNPLRFPEIRSILNRQSSLTAQTQYGTILFENHGSEESFQRNFQSLVEYLESTYKTS